MNKLADLLKKLFEAPTPAPAEETAAVKMPLLRLLFDPYALFVDNTRRFFIIAAQYALLLTFVSLAAGQGYMCLYSDYRLSGWCTNSSWLYLAAHIINLFIICMFMGRWYQACFKEQLQPFCCLLRPQKADLRCFLMIAGFILVNMIAILSAYLLYVRVPNPDWRIELIYFTVVGLGFLAPFVAMRFYSLLAFVLGGEQLPPLSAVWQRTSGNTFRILLSLTLIFFIAVFGLFAFMNNFRLVENKNALYISFIVEYLYNLVVLLIAVFFVNHCALQKIFLFERNNHGQ